MKRPSYKIVVLRNARVAIAAGGTLRRRHVIDPRLRLAVRLAIAACIVTMALASVATAATDESGPPIELGRGHGPTVDESGQGRTVFRSEDGSFFGLIDVSETGDTTKDHSDVYVLANRRVQVRKFTRSGRSAARFSKSSIGRGLTVGKAGELWQFRGPYLWKPHTLIVFGWTEGDPAYPSGRPTQPGRVLIAFDSRSGKLVANFGAHGVNLERVRSIDSAHSQPASLLPLSQSEVIECGGVYSKRFRGEAGYVRAIGPSGRPVRAFAGGLVVVPPANSHRYRRCTSVAADGQGRIYVAGVDSNQPFSSPVDVWVRRYSAAGTLDTTFGLSGEFQIDPATAVPGAQPSTPVAMSVVDAGRVLVAARSANDAHVAVAIALTEGGGLDESYGTSGALPIDNFDLHDAKFEDSGALLVAGITNSSGARAALRRFLPNGTVDTEFGSAGIKAVGDTPSAFAQIVATGPITYVWGGRTLIVPPGKKKSFHRLISRFGP